MGEANPLARVFEVRKRMKELKTGNEAVVTLGLMAGLGRMPHIVQEQFFDLLLSRASAVMTNVPGPQWELRLAGARGAASDFLGAAIRQCRHGGFDPDL